MHCRVAQLIVNERLHWTADCSCTGCDVVFHMFGRDDTPADVRDAIVADSGLARLTVELTEGASKVPLLKVFREAGESMPQAQASAQRALSTGIEGTLVELELLALRLRKKDVPAVIHPAA
jgi:hypothetical protein